MSSIRRGGAVLAALVVAGLTAAAGAGSATAAPQRAAAGHALVQGSGSSWAANAVNQWISDVNSSGLQVVFTSSGSATGRKDFANRTTDYAVSDIGFQGTDSATKSSDTSNGRGYAYLPIVSGGTSFPYQLHGQGGALIRNLRLSGPTIAGIFTGKITNWRDPAILKDNNGDPSHQIPDQQVIPVVHSEGSGSSYQFTRYLDTGYKSTWESFAGTGPTEYFPVGKGNEVAENGSDGVINFLTSAAGNGSIGYDEYSYALGKNYPVAKVLNNGGYYTLPNQYNVAVALTKAQINTNPSSPDYLLQTLDNVYSYNDVRTYPLSSYSYMVIPTAADDPRMTTARRQTIADYLYYSICQGQKEMGPIGYSPLPVNLVQAGFDQVGKLHGADGSVNLNNENVGTCNNPTFIAGQPSSNYLAKIAPKPPACDAQGQGPCTGNGNTGQANPNGGKVANTGDVPSGSGGGSGGGSGAASGGGGAGGGGGGGSGGTSGALGGGSGGTAGTAGGASGAVAGTLGASGDTLGGTTGGGVNTATGTATTSATLLPAANGAGVPVAVVAGLLLLALLVAPPIVGLILRRGRS